MQTYQRPATITRRSCLQLVSLGAVGLGLPSLLASHVLARTKAKAKSCILIWLDGGPSHLETFDLKPHAPEEVRGPFRPIKTNVVGIEICELLPELAKRMNHCAIVRSLTSPLGEHGLANQYLMTGYKPSMALSYPSFGSLLAYQRNGPTSLPKYVALRESGAGGAGYLAANFEPFVIKDDPAKENFRIQDLQSTADIDGDRLKRRMEFLRKFDSASSPTVSAVPESGLDSGSPTTSASSAEPATSTSSQLNQPEAPFEQAMRLITSPEAKRAFELSDEPADVRARYGGRSFGQSCLLARRLIERGVSFVTVNYGGWDTHDSLVLQLKQGYSGAKIGVGLLPTLDQGLSALLDDLTQRDMLDNTLVLVMGEFGRTPKVNSRGGRDHWPRVFSMLLAGGGVRGGQVIGASDRTGESPLDFPVTPVDLAHSIYRLLGVDPDTELHTPDGRPVRINQGGKWIEGLS